MAENKYYIGGANYFGDNSPNDKFNDSIAPRLLELGVSEKDMKEVANMFADIYEIGYQNGSFDEGCDD